MTNAVECLGMRWKEKSLAIVAGPFTEYNLEMLLRSSATVVNAGSGEWWRAWRHWARGWTIEAARRPVCGTESLKPTPFFYAKKALFCDPKLPVKRRIDAFYSTCVPAALHGAGEWAYTQQCSRHCSPVPFVESCACACWCHCGSAAEATQSTTLANFGNETCACCCLADDELRERCERSQILGRICDMALRRNVERRIHQTVQRGLSEQHAVETPSPRETEQLGASLSAFLGRRLDTETEGL